MLHSWQPHGHVQKGLLDVPEGFLKFAKIALASFRAQMRFLVQVALEGEADAAMQAIARTAKHRLERGIWTSPGAGQSHMQSSDQVCMVVVGRTVAVDCNCLVVVKHCLGQAFGPAWVQVGHARVQVSHAPAAGGSCPGAGESCLGPGGSCRNF